MYSRCAEGHGGCAGIITLIKPPADDFKLVNKQLDNIRDLLKSEVQGPVDVCKDANIRGPQREAVKFVSETVAETLGQSVIVTADSFDTA